MSVDLLLVNPPLWNAFAPHLAVPLLLAVAKEAGFQARGLDLSAESMDCLLSPSGLAALEDRLVARAGSADELTDRRARRGLMLMPHVVSHIDAAKDTLRSLAALADPVATRQANITLRNALWVASAAFDRAKIDLFANDLYHSARSSAEVLAATTDLDRNVYRWAFEYLGLADRITELNPAVIGISVSADTQLVAAMTVARMARETGWGGQLVLGGNFVTRIATRWRQRHPFFDLVDSMVLHEGEDAIIAACANAVTRRSRPVPGEVRPDGDRLVRTQTKTVDLECLPAPDYRDFDLTKYLAPGPILPTYASRSCAWDCAFCSIPFASNKFRSRSSERIVAEMTTLERRHGARHFCLVDEIATTHSLRTLSDELLDHRKDYSWYAETRVSAAWKRPLTDRLYASGCRRLSLGIESYNQRVLDKMRKGTKVEVIDSSIEAFLRSGIPVHLFCIVGFPGETAAEAARTIDYASGVCARASDEFGLPETTWAAAPFVLDLHSPVGQQPHEYGLIIIPPPPEEDLALTVDYQMVGGSLKQEDSWRLMCTVEAVDQWPDSDRREPVWFGFPAIRHIEERLFLRACEKVPTDETSHHIAAIRPGQLLQLVPDVAFGRLEGSDGKLTDAVYSPESDAVVYLPPGLAEQLRRGGLAAELVARTAADPVLRAEIAETVAALGRMRVFVGVDEQRLTSEAVRHRVIRREVGAEGHYDSAAGWATLSSRATGQRLRTGSLGFGLFLLSAEGVRLDDARLDRLPGTVGQRRELAVEMVKAGLVCLDSAASVDPGKA